MVDNMLAPQVFGYNKADAASNAGAFGQTGLRSSPASSPEPLIKVHYPVDRRGMFQDRPSPHGGGMA